MIRKNIYLTVLIFLFVAGCETEVEILNTEKDVYAINCILDTDSTVQYATVLKNYFVDTNDPLDNTNSPFVQDVVLSVTDEEGNNYNFVEATRPSPDPARYSEDMTYYYCENFKPAGREKYTLSAELATGEYLTAETTVPGYTYFLFDNFEAIYPGYQDYFAASWQYTSGSQDRFIYKPSLTLYYYFDDGNSLEPRSKIFPESYVAVGGEEVPVYPGARGVPTLYISDDAMFKSFASISADDQDFGLYRISHLELEIQVFDAELGAYYMLNQVPENGFTVILDYLDYTNISNGRGVFGSVTRETQRIDVANVYLEMFVGYTKYDPDE